MFKNNIKEGMGTFKTVFGDVYTGEYINDKKEGKGTYKPANGLAYNCEFKNDFILTHN